MPKRILSTVFLMGLALTACQAAPQTEEEAAPVGNDEIQIEEPQSGEVVTSPLEVNGKVRGFWMFEANFDVRMEDINGRELATAPGTATDSWMTEDFVPFTTTLEFDPGSATEGKIIFLQASPSGGLEGPQRKTFEIPVRFQEFE